MTRREEQRLIERAAAGDRAAAEACIRAHQASLYAYLLRLSGRPDLAEDVAQEAFVRVLTHLDRFDPRFRFSTWLFTIAKRVYINACQKLRPASCTDALGGTHDAADGPGEPIVSDEVAANSRDAVQRALMVLPEAQREIVILFHLLDWPIAVIAQHMDMPAGTVKSHLHRGRRRLREALERCERDAARVREVWA